MGRSLDRNRSRHARTISDPAFPYFYRKLPSIRRRHCTSFENRRIYYIHIRLVLWDLAFLYLLSLCNYIGRVP